ncbi:MAG: MBOAT family protein, partial [Lachnospiraceae bacterium]|nr:MBOAT family protein [Lachnospiraceae bacterium]
MLFNSLAFGVFLTIVFFLYWGLPHAYRWMLLLVASYYFYMNWSVRYVVLILFTTFVSFGCARLVEGRPDSTKKRILLAGTAIASLSVLFFFKYFNFASRILSKIFALIQIPLHPITLSFLLPVGISFYTFQTLSYVVDVYRGDLPAEKNFFKYALFISFFPQLVAGPIERADHLLPQ